jgi:hypothetical protein
MLKPTPETSAPRFFMPPSTNSTDHPTAIFRGYQAHIRGTDLAFDLLFILT